MTELSLVRHCQALANTMPERINGRSNLSPATPRGLYQAALLGAHFRETGVKFDAIYSSKAVRADATAETIIDAAGYDQSFTTDERLQELSQGEWEGRHRDHVYTPEMIALRRLDKDGIDTSLPGAESIQDGQVRIGSFLDEVVTEYPDGKLLIVSHGLLIRSLVGRIRGLNKPEILALATPNCSLTRIDTDGTEWEVLSVGETVITE